MQQTVCVVVSGPATHDDGAMWVMAYSDVAPRLLVFLE